MYNTFFETLWDFISFPFIFIFYIIVSLLCIACATVFFAILSPVIIVYLIVATCKDLKNKKIKS